MGRLRQPETPAYNGPVGAAGLGRQQPGPCCNQAELPLGHQEHDMGAAYGHIAQGVPNTYADCEKIKVSRGNVTRQAGPVKGGPNRDRAFNYP